MKQFLIKNKISLLCCMLAFLSTVLATRYAIKGLVYKKNVIPCQEYVFDDDTIIVREPQLNQQNPQSQDGLWHYDIFTPPRLIYNKVTRAYFALPVYLNQKSKNTLDLKLLDISLEVYPVLLEGYSQDRGGKTLFFLYDACAQKALTLRLGQKENNSSFFLQAFEPAFWNHQTQALEEAKLEVFDYILNRSFILTPQKKTFTDAFCVLLQGQLGEEIIFKKIGEEVLYKDGTLTLKLAHLETKSVVLEYKLQDAMYPEYIYLFCL